MGIELALVALAGASLGGAPGAEARSPDAAAGSRPTMALTRAKTSPTPTRATPPTARATPPTARTFAANGCSPDMVRISTFCIDRWEIALVDDRTGEPLSPYYPPNATLIRYIYAEWTDRIADGTAGLLDMPLPPVPGIELTDRFRPRAVSQSGVVPQGYLNLPTARAACEAAGKRLCTLDEWLLACRGQEAMSFPYGDTYRRGGCNVFRDEHPGHLLHGTFSQDLLDPRMNLVVFAGEPLLRPTGATPTCVSRWGRDGPYDMVGNLDEWVEAEESTFVGGFFARATRNGCDATVRSHGASYFDYSTGGRCCDAAR